MELRRKTAGQRGETPAVTWLHPNHQPTQTSDSTLPLPGSVLVNYNEQGVVNFILPLVTNKKEVGGLVNEGSGYC